MEIPVFLFGGFLESGKTSFINDTVAEESFTDGERILIIACEEGEEEYNSKQLAAFNTTVEYVARFEVSWEEVNYDKNGNEVVTTQNWSDNGKHVTAGYSTTILFPGNVRNIHVKAQGATGLVWEPWRTSLDQRFDLVDKRTISISGTTLNQKSNVNP